MKLKLPKVNFSSWWNIQLWKSISCVNKCVCNKSWNIMILMFCLKLIFLLKPFSIAQWFSLNFSTRLVFFIFLPFKWVSRQKWACLEILMRKIVAIATDLSFSGRQVCSYQCPSISSLCAPDTIGNRYKQLYFPPNVPGKCSILWTIPKLISLLTVSVPSCKIIESFCNIPNCHIELSWCQNGLVLFIAPWITRIYWVREW